MGPNIRLIFDTKAKKTTTTIQKKDCKGVVPSSDRPIIDLMLEVYANFKLADLVRVWNARAEVNASNKQALRSSLSSDISKKVKLDSSNSRSSNDSSSSSSTSSSSSSSSDAMEETS